MFVALGKSVPASLDEIDDSFDVKCRVQRLSQRELCSRLISVASAGDFGQLLHVKVCSSTLLVQVVPWLPLSDSLSVWVGADCRLSCSSPARSFQNRGLTAVQLWLVKSALSGVRGYESPNKFRSVRDITILTFSSASTDSHHRVTGMRT